MNFEKLTLSVTEEYLQFIYGMFLGQLVRCKNGLDKEFIDEKMITMNVLECQSVLLKFMSKQEIEDMKTAAIQALLSISSEEAKQWMHNFIDNLPGLDLPGKGETP